ncbi:MAG: hypothetical protein QM783_03970 [Phycisphaerales bacterium]
MDTDTLHITRPFERMGARVEVVPFAPRRGIANGRVRVDIVKDHRGQKFSIAMHDSVRLCVPDVDPAQRHLLLNCVVAETSQRHKYLCGHDEREWFAAAVPDRRGVSGVRTAIEALKPGAVVREVARRGVHPDEYASRNTAAYKRQGEWFFIPHENFRPPELLVRRNERLSRNDRGKPHWADFGYRTGGETVFSTDGLGWITLEQYKKFVQRRHWANARWTTAQRNAQLYVKGRIRHPDHATITLDCWHMVQMNTENESAAMRHLAFID